MQFDWTTFALEILNFLVLLWILKRFLYRPVLDMLDARQQAMREQAARAEAVRKEAETLKAEYEARLADWQVEREKAWQALEQELEREKDSALEKLKKQMIEEKEKRALHEQAAAATHEATLGTSARRAAYARASAMLRRLASPELTATIVAVFEEDVRNLPDAQRDTLRDAAAAQEGAVPVDIATAHPIGAEARERIVGTLSAAAARPLQPAFRVAPELMAGVRVAVGQCLLQANLADELAFFQEQDGHG
jgi:F-type H+-transporting ATPase subunit b